MASATINMKTHNDMNIVTPQFLHQSLELAQNLQRFSFSPQSAGRVKLNSANAEINIDGRTKLKP